MIHNLYEDQRKLTNDIMLWTERLNNCLISITPEALNYHLKTELKCRS